MLKLLFIVLAIFVVLFVANYFIFAIIFTLRTVIFLSAFGLICYYLGKYSHTLKNKKNERE